MQNEYVFLSLVFFFWMLLLLLMTCFGREEPVAGRNRGQPRPSSQAAAQPPAPPAATQLPYFPYAQPGGGGRAAGSSSGKTVVCAICLEQLRHGDLCSEVPACRHVFHRDCVGAWMKSSSTCPLCRVEITPDFRLSRAEVPVADMV